MKPRRPSRLERLELLQLRSSLLRLEVVRASLELAAAPGMRRTAALWRLGRRLLPFAAVGARWGHRSAFPRWLTLGLALWPFLRQRR